MKRARIAGALLVAVALLWQVAAVAHLALSVHAVCAEHHAIAHGNANKGDLHHHEHGSPFDSEDSCFVLAALLHAGALTEVPAVAAVIAQNLDFEAIHALVDHLVLHQRERYRIAPSQSPPSAPFV
ncbi:MAG: hypothetical protein MUF54_13140 [Polyangiaceae bacterium]|jgi:hypothetical protein|nr:hypothetical protein [Polyangiaceae bacterium]